MYHIRPKFVVGKDLMDWSMIHSSLISWLYASIHFIKMFVINFVNILDI